MDMVQFAVELLQVGCEGGAHLSHDLLAARQYLVGEGLTPVLGDAHQADVKVGDDVASGPDIGMRVPAR
ncbi:hypothetical protein GCM10022207_59910 [Streptomyces lannensis]|uniref:Uncharacterized protein n=1 Tax=Streptomyces lannensis TaxID=766498 RepID=A0ABP7KPH2_9ACTN